MSTKWADVVFSRGKTARARHPGEDVSGDEAGRSTSE